MSAGDELLPNETRLEGKWIMVDGRMIGDPVCERIERLTKNYLQKIGTDESGWDSLFRDPSDGRWWERIYLQSYLHGGGPPTLLLLNSDEVRKKYWMLFQNMD